MDNIKTCQTPRPPAIFMYRSIKTPGAPKAGRLGFGAFGRSLALDEFLKVNPPFLVFREEGYSGSGAEVSNDDTMKKKPYLGQPRK